MMNQFETPVSTHSAEHLITKALVANHFMVVPDHHAGRAGLIALKMHNGRRQDAFVVELFQETEAGHMPEHPLRPFEVAQMLQLPCFQAFVNAQGTMAAVSPELHARMRYDRDALTVHEFVY